MKISLQPLFLLLLLPVDGLLPSDAGPAVATGVTAATGPKAPQSVMNSIALRWNFEDGADDWAQSTALEMGVEVDAVNGDLRGIVLPSVKFGAAFVDSPELRVEVQEDERDFLVFRMKLLGLCDVSMISLERNPSEPSVNLGTRRERTEFHDPVRIPFNVRANTLDSELYYIPIWKHVTGTIYRVRFHPCVALPSVDLESTADTAPSQYGQTFQIDWVAFAKAPVITKVRGCIDKYFSEADEIATMNCTEHPRRTNGFHHNTAFECFPMALPLASTYNCKRDGGGHRISISGKHFGKSDAIVTIDGVECLDVVHVEPETELECTLPPVSAQWLAAPAFPSTVRVRNGQLHDLFDDVPLLSYAAPVSARPIPVISNVAAHAVDVNWVAPSTVWEAMTVTGYRVSWKLCNDAAYATSGNSVVVGNVTSTTVIDLLSSTGYQVKVAALTEDYRRREVWQDIDLYGHREMMPGAVIGLESPSSRCVWTPANDFVFSEFTARLLTNVSTPQTSPTLGPTGEIGDQGHFGLYVNGHANVQNCNASVSCCDGYSNATVGGEAAYCTYTCSETEARATTYQDRTIACSPPTNAQFAIPFPAKAVRSSTTASALPVGAFLIAPVSNACGPALRLTASDSLLTGSAWYPRQMNVREGFETSFMFRLSNPSTFCKSMDDVYTSCRSRGGDGFAFVAQNDQAIGIGSGGMELGYGGLKNALAVEFDTWFNHEQLDVYENHISIHVSGDQDAIQASHTFALGSTSNILDLADGDHSVRIVYDPALDEDMIFSDHFVASTLAGHFLSSGDWGSGVGLLSVFLDNMDTPVLSVPLRIEHTVQLNHGRAWVGFTAATGERAWQTHDILAWTFRSLRRGVVSPASTPV